MAKVRFYLKEPYKNGLCAVYLVLEKNKKRLKFVTALSLAPQYWDSDTQRAKTKGVKIKDFDYVEFNKALQDMETDVQRFIIKTWNDVKRFPTVLELKTELDRLSDRNQAKPVTLFDFLETLILERKNDIKGNNRSQQFNTLLIHLKAFCQHHRKTTLDFSDINHNFLNDFKAFAYNVKLLNPNTLNKYVNIIKTVVREAQNRELHQSNAYQFLTTNKVPTHEIYLNESELEKMYRLDLSDRKGHEAVRDLFIIGCFTGGQRFSDWSKLKAENIFIENDKQFFRYVSKKTETEAVLPLNHTYVQEILKKYNNILPIFDNNQVANRYLKDIGKLAQIDTPTNKITYPKGIKTESIEPKYKLITTHTARRSLATNMKNRKFSLYEIRLLTGHASEKQLEEYLKTSSLENAVTVANTDFFK
jgi:integrase